MNFEEVYEKYLKFASKQQKKSSFENLRNSFNLRILPYFKDKDIYTLTINDVIDWQSEILKFNYSNRYNKNLHFMLSGFLHYCCTFHNLKNNVASQVGCFKKKYEVNKTDFYTLNEFKKFIKYVDNNIYKQFFNLMFYTGTRPGEAMALKISDLHDDYIYITKTIDSHNGRNITTPKTPTSVRKIKIDNRLKNDLKFLHNFYKKKYNNSDYDYYIFGGMKPLAPTTINRYKKKACNKANLRPITLHQFRHSHATLLLTNNILINEVSRRLGHSKVSTTLNIYTHTDLTQEKRVSKKLNYLRYSFLTNLRNSFKKLYLFITTLL